MPPDITPTSKSIKQGGDDTEPCFTFNTQKTCKRALKIVQKSENKQQGIKGAQGDELLDDTQFSVIKRTF